MDYPLLTDSVHIKKISEKENIGNFVIEGLYTGYGPTIGNSLRRALLSSLPGAAITQIKVKGVNHEFSTLPGMSEDIVEFTLNLKRVRFKFFADEPQTLSLKIKGNKKITAGDIKTTTFVEIVNPDLHLATLSKKNAELDMEIVVEKGLGYASAEDRKGERLPIGTIILDSIFSPIVRVDFDVENTRVGERTDYNRIKLEIETDGSITPSEAFHKTTSILKHHFEKLYEADAIAPKDTAKKKTTKKKKE
ncbi:DNA-directed RNA polymerase subunit alpha [bacterium]|nr:DNA-directed RNA polymerase subunit alpha [bacterium]|tara:strand:- start:47 stop:793 length:747 start_codon:yes stop_codon:yes gene_type:complete